MAAESVIVDTNTANSVNSYIITQQISDTERKLYGSHTLAWSDEVSYGDETGSIKITCTKAGAVGGTAFDSNGYLVLSNPMLLKDISAYDYIAFMVYVSKGAQLRFSWAWADYAEKLTAFADTDDVVSDSDGVSFKVNVSEFLNNKVRDPFGPILSATDITYFSIYVREMAYGDSVYISSLKAYKN